MMDTPQRPLLHPQVSRRTAVQAGAVGLLGMGMNHLGALHTEAASTASAVTSRGSAKACIYIFLSGGLAQQDSFDLKPNAPDDIRGEFKPIATRTPGVQICEHLPGLAQRSHLWALVRSLTHPTNGHTLGHYYMLTGRSVKSPGFRGDRKPRSSDWPAIASVVGDALPARTNNLPPAIVLPERLVHWSGGVLPGAYAGIMGRHRDPFFIEASPYGNPFWRGAYPEYTFNQAPKDKAKNSSDERIFQAPSLKLTPGMSFGRLSGRLDLLQQLDRQRHGLERSAESQPYDRHRQSAISLHVNCQSSTESTTSLT